MMKLKALVLLFFISLALPAALFSQLKKINTFEDKGFVPSTFQVMSAMLYQNQPSPLIRKDKQSALQGIGELSAGLNAQFVIKKNILSIGLGQTVQKYTVSNEDPFLYNLIFFWLKGCNDCAFKKAHYKNNYIVIPIGYSRILYNKGKSRYLFSAAVELSNEFKYDTKLDMVYFDSAQVNPEPLEPLLMSYQTRKHQLRLRLGFGFKWRAFVPDTFGFNLKLMLQTMLTSINDEFMGRPYGAAVQFGMQYNFAPSKNN